MHPFMKQISVIYRCAMMYRENELNDTGLAGNHTPCLMALYRHPGISQEELARRIHNNKSTITRQLCALEAAGYVRREPSPDDRRVTLVWPTEKALAIEARIRDVMHGWNAYLTEELTDEEKAVLSGLMDRITARAEDYVTNGGEAACNSSEST